MMKIVKKMKKAYEHIKSFLNIHKIIETSMSLQKLKYLLMSSYEADLFDSIGNPTIRTLNKGD